MKAGPEFEREASRVVRPTWTLDKPFVLGYALKKIRRTVMGATRSADYDDHALWGEGPASRQADLRRVIMANLRLYHGNSSTPHKEICDKIIEKSEGT